MDTGKRRIPFQTYIFFFSVFGLALFLVHTPFLQLPYFWDEVGHFIPAALDLFRLGAWIPRSTAPTVHPPGLMAFLAAFWSVAGYSIAGTRVAMLMVAAAGLLVAFLLAIRLSANLPARPAFLVVVFLVLTPLYYAQSMLALPDLPAMLFTCMALLLFLQDRTAASAAACVALVMVKETGIVVPLVLALWLVRERRWREAAYFTIPCAALGGWMLALKHGTGHYLGNAPTSRRVLIYLIHPVRFPLELLRRLYYLFIADFRWIGTMAIVWTARRSKVFRVRDWRIATSVAAAHVLALSLFGWEMLDRDLLPAVPIVYSAMIAGFSPLGRWWKRIGLGALAAGLVAGTFWNPPYPFELDDNIAFVDSVRLQAAAAGYIEFRYPNRTVLTAWPLGSALERSEYGYVGHALRIEQVPDFRASTLRKVDWSKVGVLVIYSRAWEPRRSLWRMDAVRWLLERYHGYEPEQDAPPFTARLEHAGRWQRRDQWVDVYVAPRAEGGTVAQPVLVHFTGKPIRGYVAFSQ